MLRFLRSNSSSIDRNGHSAQPGRKKKLLLQEVLREPDIRRSASPKNWVRAWLTFRLTSELTRGWAESEPRVSQERAESEPRSEPSTQWAQQWAQQWVSISPGALAWNVSLGAVDPVRVFMWFQWLVALAARTGLTAGLTSGWTQSEPRVSREWAQKGAQKWAQKWAKHARSQVRPILGSHATSSSHVVTNDQLHSVEDLSPSVQRATSMDTPNRENFCNYQFFNGHNDPNLTWQGCHHLL